MISIGITGPTGAGKTTALEAVAALGGTVIDCDKVYHQLLDTSPLLQNILSTRFPQAYDGGVLNRKKLGSLVFDDPAALVDLNALTHRFVLTEVARLVQLARTQEKPAVAIDAIALIESGVGKTCDVTVAVVAPAALRIARIMAREGISEDYATQRVSAQQGEDFYRTHCTHTLENSESLTREAFFLRAKALFATIINP